MPKESSTKINARAMFQALLDAFPDDRIDGHWVADPVGRDKRIGGLARLIPVAGMDDAQLCVRAGPCRPDRQDL